MTDPYYEYYSESEEDSYSKNESNHTKVMKPVYPEQVLRLYLSRLTDYEKEEIKRYDEIYFIGNNVTGNKVRPLHSTQYNHGFDDEKGAYLFESHDHIAYRYEILKQLGKGAFGCVVQAYDHKRNRRIALKVIRNKRPFHKQAKTEFEILKYLKYADRKDKFNFVSMKSYFLFRNHVCITFELLTINLYSYLKGTEKIGCSQSLVRKFTYSIVKSLCALSQLRIVHCDLKPENIVLRVQNKSGIKLIDFGSSCFEHRTCFKYLQSRFYRAPEVILQLEYGLPIDIFSLGCITYELTNGEVLFKGENYLSQLGCIMEVMGHLPEKMCKSKVFKEEFVKSEYYVTNPDAYWQKSKKRLPPGSREKSLFQDLKNSPETTNLKDFVKKCLILDPMKRMKPIEALEHPYLNLKREKVKYILNQVELLPNKSYINKNFEANQWMKKLSIRD